MINFKEIGVPAEMLDTLVKMNFINPTPIQEKAIPIALQGHDILGSAQTGTGKTAAFAIPLISHLINNTNSTALVLLPTRELAMQVLDAANKMLGNIGNIKSALLIGGDSIGKQFQQLQRKPRLIVGTPGRINDHLSRKSLNLKFTDFLVLDETDRMLDMGFGMQLDEIAKFLPKERQTLMFSATLPKNIMSLSKKYLNNPVRIAVGNDNEVVPKIKQEVVKTTDNTKYIDLVHQINTRNGSLLVFVKTKFGADKLAVRLSRENFSTGAIHGNLRQTKRDHVISDFRKQRFRVLVATDIAARGLDIPHIENVINYDLPQCPEDYIHRIGRTGRAGAEGVAINFLTSKDNSKWREIKKLIGADNFDEDDSPYQKNRDEKPISKNRKRKKFKARSNAENPSNQSKHYESHKKSRSRAKFGNNAKTFKKSNSKAKVYA